VAKFAGGQVVRSEWRFRRKDGSCFTGEVLGRQLSDGRLEAVVRDITERRQTEEALRESESFYRQTLESIPGMVFTTRPDGYCDYQSQQWVDFTGVPISEHLGDGWNKLLHPDDRPRAFAAWRNAVEGRAPYDTEYRVRRHDGTYEWFKVRGRPIRNSAGEVVRWFGTALNIDHLVKAQAELQRSQRLYRAIGESINYGIWVCEPDGRNTYASESFLKLVGMTQEQCSSFGWGEVLHPDDAERTIAAWKECVRTGGTWDIEHRFRGADGEWHPILARGVPVRDEEGRVLCWAGINLDISRLKRT
jgi:PAS domain S-box-containing protein